MIKRFHEKKSYFFQIGRHIRDKCRNLRGKHPSGGASSNPEDFSSLQAPNVSVIFFKFLRTDDSIFYTAGQKI